MASNSEFLFDGERGLDYLRIADAIPHYESYQNEVVQQVLQKLNDASDEYVVDLGCGPGALLEHLSNSTCNVNFVGVDPSSTFARLVNQHNNRRIQFAKNTAFEWLESQKSESFDVVCSCWAFHNWSKEYRAKVFAQVSRILKRRGMFINADKIACPD
ncbi:MAG: class I SAM-dependent methyltransferase, partial [Psychrosphaera sp.]|nr:class I SAM-dependent methyltransferase [Psychrosphaera sp.]